MVNDMFLEKLSQTKLYKLAVKQLKREGKLTKISSSENMDIYEVDPLEAIVKGLEIVQLANKKGIKI